MTTIIFILSSELGKRNARASKPAPSVNKTLFHVEHLTRQQIERQYQLMGQIIPASSHDITIRRTSYFYRKEAIAWAREARRAPWSQIVPVGTAARLAKSYLSVYRQMKGIEL